MKNLLILLGFLLVFASCGKETEDGNLVRCEASSSPETKFINRTGSVVTISHASGVCCISLQIGEEKTVSYHDNFYVNRELINSADYCSTRTVITVRK